MKEKTINEYYDLDNRAMNFKSEDLHWLSLSTIQYLIMNTNYVSVNLRNMIALL